MNVMLLALFSSGLPEWGSEVYITSDWGVGGKFTCFLMTFLKKIFPLNQNVYLELPWLDCKLGESLISVLLISATALYRLLINLGVTC